MASKIFDVILHDANGLPSNAVSPVFSYYEVFNSAGKLPVQPVAPQFSQVSGETGRFTFTVTLQPGEYARMQIYRGSVDPSAYEYLLVEYADLLSQADVASNLTGIKSKTDLIPPQPATAAAVESARLAAVWARKILSNRITWDASTGRMLIYDDNAVDVMCTLDFTDQDGHPSVISPLNRTPVSSGGTP